MDEYRGRKSLDLELLDVETKINVLYRLVNTAFNESMDALYEKDLSLSKKIIEEDKKINELSSEIESLAINVIRNQTPVATDIRKLTSHIFVAQELERIGDYLRGISRINTKIGKEPFITKFEKIPKMEKVAKEMLKMKIVHVKYHMFRQASGLVLRDRLPTALPPWSATLHNKRTRRLRR